MEVDRPRRALTPTTVCQRRTRTLLSEQDPEPDAPEIVLHNALSDVRATWASLASSGGYALYVDANGVLHGLSIAVTTKNGIRGNG
ncbi:hypothetical protein [Microbacterium sp. Leaf179]|uniref:hypothetical protein n=1 Tax=Microbacterium sp. Leaf179 TaxID=1736288 RepID=UPI000A635CD4|nr:hypothetical protein [Microbacterium sp. Leaf179]